MLVLRDAIEDRVEHHARGHTENEIRTHQRTDIEDLADHLHGAHFLIRRALFLHILDDDPDDVGQLGDVRRQPDRRRTGRAAIHEHAGQLTDESRCADRRGIRGSPQRAHR